MSFKTSRRRVVRTRLAIGLLCAVLVHGLFAALLTGGLRATALIDIAVFTAVFTAIGSVLTVRRRLGLRVDEGGITVTAAGQEAVVLPWSEVASTRLHWTTGLRITAASGRVHRVDTAILTGGTAAVRRALAVRGGAAG